MQPEEGSFGYARLNEDHMTAAAAASKEKSAVPTDMPNTESADPNSIKVYMGGEEAATL
jgi:hypothetical protein